MKLLCTLLLFTLRKQPENFRNIDPQLLTLLGRKPADPLLFIPFVVRQDAIVVKRLVGLPNSQLFPIASRSADQEQRARFEQ